MREVQAAAARSNASNASGSKFVVVKLNTSALLGNGKTQMAIEAMTNRTLFAKFSTSIGKIFQIRTVTEQN